MRPIQFIIILLFSAAIAMGQSRTAERIVDVPFSQLSVGNPPNGSIRHVINGTPGTSPCTGGGTGAMAIRIAGVWQCPRLTVGTGTGDVVGPSASIDDELALYSGTSGKLLKRTNTLTGIPLLTGGVVTVLPSSGSGSVARTTSPTFVNPTLGSAIATSLSLSTPLSAASGGFGADVSGAAGVPLFTAGVPAFTSTTGTGTFVRTGNPTIIQPTITSFASSLHTHQDAAGGGQLNATSVFSAGTVPPARIISGSLATSKCLRLSNTGLIEVAAEDCGTGGGAPGGVSGNFIFNEAGAFGGASNTSYTSATGVSAFNQKANGNDTLTSLRFTDSGPTGNFLRFRNAANSTDLFRVGVDGVVALSNTVISTNVAAPATPAVGTTVLWTDSTDKNLRAQDDGGNISITVRALACTGTDKISAISSAGVVTCSADQTTAGGSGITTLNTLVTSSQTFSKVDDTNVTLTITSTTSDHQFALGWTGTLAKARQNAATVYNDASNTFSTGAQSFAAATSLTVPTIAGASPTTSGQIAYDTTSTALEYGDNGSNRLVANTAGAQTFSNKTLDNSTTANLRDTQFTLQDNADSTKTANFELTGVTTGTNRVITVANANSVTVIPSTATTNQWVTHIDSTGTQVKAQPAFSNLSGSLGPTQGGTGQTSTVQGDILYADAANSWARLPKNISATRYLSNTGTSNNPAWAQVDLSNGVTGALPFASLSGSATDAQIPNNITIDLATVATTANAGDSATAFFSTGQIEVARLGSGTPDGTKFLRDDGVFATPAGSGDMVLAGVQVVTGAKTFDPAKLIVGSVSATPTAATGAFYRDSDDTKLYWSYDGVAWGEVFVSGVSQVNLASANVTGDLPFANFVPATAASKLVGRGSASGAGDFEEITIGSGLTMTGTTLSTSGGGSGTINAGATNAIPKYVASTTIDDSLLSDDATTLTYTGTGGVSAPLFTATGSGAGYLELAEGTAPTVVANRLTFTAPVDVPAAGLLYILPSDTPTNGEQLTANISGTTVTLSWDTAGAGGSGDAVSVNGSAATDANLINTAASGTVPSITWSLNTVATPDEVSISAIGAASATEAGVVTTGTQTFAGAKTFTGTVTIPTPFTLGAVSVTPTGTELNFVDGVTSSIQTQLDGKQAGPLTGDVTTSGAAATIANDAVTYAKMQNVSVASKLLGRGDSGAGDVQEITIGGGLAMTGTTLSATGGGSITGADTHVMFFDGANNPAGDAGLTYNKTTDVLTVVGALNFSGFTGLAQSAAGIAKFTDGSTGLGSLLVVKSNTGGIFFGDTSTSTGGLIRFDTDNAFSFVRADVGASAPISFQAASVNSTSGAAVGLAGDGGGVGVGSNGMVNWSSGINGAAGGFDTAIKRQVAGVLEINNGTAGVERDLSLRSTLFNGTTSGVVTVTTAAAAGTWTMTLPTTAGGANQFLQTNGAGVLTWADPLGTVTATGGALTANSVVLGAGTTDTKVVAGIVTDGTSKLTLGVAGTSVGSVDFKNATSGTITLAPVTGALGAVTISLPATTGTVALTANKLDVFAATTSSELATVLSDEEGTAGGFVRATSPTLTTPVLGVATATSINGLTITTSTGTLTIANGKTATINNSITFAGTDATTMTFPSTTGSVLTADSTATVTNKTIDVSATGNTFTSTHKPWIAAAGCQNTTAFSNWDLPTTTPAVAACVTGTNTQKGYLDFADTSGGFSAQYTLQLPDDFTGTIDADIQWLTTATSGNVKWSLSVSCTNTDATQTDDQAFETASTVTTAAPGIASRVQTSSITSQTITNCGPNDIMHIKLFRDGADAADTITATARFYGLRLTLRRAQ